MLNVEAPTQLETYLSARRLQAHTNGFFPGRLKVSRLSSRVMLSSVAQCPRNLAPSSSAP